LKSIINGLTNVHDVDIICRNLHSENILDDLQNMKISDLETELTDNGEIYGIILGYMRLKL
jgi:hypothetical protein